MWSGLGRWVGLLVVQGKEKLVHVLCRVYKNEANREERRKNGTKKIIRNDVRTAMMHGGERR